VASLLTKAALQIGQPLGFEKGVLTVGYPAGSESQLMLVDTDRTRKAIEGRLAEFAGRSVVLKFVKGGVPVPGAAAAAAPAPVQVKPAVGSSGASGGGGNAPIRTRPEKPVPVVPIKLDPAEFKNDPLIREAIELFKGQLVEVRRPEEPQAGE
jgi:hypothetical protein